MTESVDDTSLKRFAHEIFNTELSALFKQRNIMDVTLAERCAPNGDELVDEHAERLARQTGMPSKVIKRYAKAGIGLRRMPKLKAIAMERGCYTLDELYAMADETITVAPASLREVEATVIEASLPTTDGEAKPGLTTFANRVHHAVEHVAPLDVKPRPRTREYVRINKRPVFSDLPILEAALTRENMFEFESILTAIAHHESCSQPEALMHMARATTDAKVVLNVFRGVDETKAWLPGVGWLSDVATDSWMARAEKMRLLSDSDSDGARLATDAQRQIVIARDGTCRYSGCDVPAHLCEIDHIKPWPEGPSDSQNMQALCKRHHNLKTSKLVHATTDTTTNQTVWSSLDGNCVVSIPNGPLAGYGRTTWGETLDRLSKTRNTINKEHQQEVREHILHTLHSLRGQPTATGAQSAGNAPPGEDVPVGTPEKLTPSKAPPVGGDCLPFVESEFIQPEQPPF